MTLLKVQSLSSVKIAKDATNFATIEVAGELNEKGLDISVVLLL
jgi:hypothetical protein